MLALLLTLSIDFTAAQARQGEAIYAKSCAGCHGSQLTAGTAPTLTGALFQAKHTLDGLLDAIRRMPPNTAEHRPPAEVFALAAFVLEKNGHAATAKEMTAGSPEPIAAARAAAAPKSSAPEFIAGDPSAKPAAGAGPTQDELNRAVSNARDWLYHTHDYHGTRHAPAAQITPKNAASLRVACAFQTGELTNFQAGPIVYEGRMYFTTLQSTFAIDARTCALIWKHEWTVRDRNVWPMNRGVALGHGYAVRGTSDGYLVALNARTGALVWARQIAKPALGETLTMAPMIFEDRVLMGPAGGENGVSGWVGAFALADGAPLWRFKTVPVETWQNPKNIKLGGGSIWTPLSLDPTTGDLHVAVTNPAPDIPAHMRPDDNLYTNSLLVLDARTGAYRWHKQIVKNDSHDYDFTQASPVFTATINGKPRRLIATVGKDGVLRTLDRQTREYLYETPVTTVENQDVPVTTKGVHACPGALGGVEWNGPALDPALNRLFTPAVDFCGTYFAAPDDAVKYVPGALYMGGRFQGDKTKRGWLTAVDAVTGQVAWKYESPEPMVAGVTTTAGGVVFAGELTGHLTAFDAKTGAVLMRLQTGGPIGGGVVSYALDGQQYVAVASGRPSQFWWGKHPGAPTVFVLALP